MRAGTDQVQILDIFALVVRAKPRALSQDRLQPKGGAAKRGEPVLEILRRQQALADDLVLQTRQYSSGEFACNRQAIIFGHHAPVGSALQMRDR